MSRAPDPSALLAALEGRWLIDFGNQGPADTTGNEFILTNGKVGLAITGHTVGRYEAREGLLIITIPMPEVEPGVPWCTVARLFLPDPLAPGDKLVGLVEAVVSPEEKSVIGTCTFIRRSANA